MSLNINTNLAAFKASNRVQSHYENLSRSVHRLTTGKRLNSSEDSPVDMAVHNVHNGRIATLEKGKQNLHDAISMVQTAESAMARIDELLIKMKEIATNSATGTVTDVQRMILSSEFGQLANEIDRISRATEFKGHKLLDGSLSEKDMALRYGSFYTTDSERVIEDEFNQEQSGMKIHFGVRNERQEDYYFVRIGDLSMNGLLKGVGDPDVDAYDKIGIASQHDAQQTLETINSALIAKEGNRYIMGIMQNRLEASLNFREDEILFLNGINSQLADVDFATEMSVFAKSQLLMEASTAILAQANVLPRIAMKLLNF
ncbi:MAG: flagellin [Candidatus Cloacimonetes bacterium]|nr:flagellin [Candidatus Cloacimonadota bacterium]